jgi:hypothetical protein
MDVGMMKQRLRPGVEDREKADAGAEMHEIRSDLEERLRGGAKEDRIDDLLVSQGEGGELGRHGADDVEVGDREELRLPLREPSHALVAETEGAVPVAAGVVGSRGFWPLPCSTCTSMRAASMLSAFRATVSVIRRPAAYAVSSAMRHTGLRTASMNRTTSSWLSTTGSVRV